MDNPTPEHLMRTAPMHSWKDGRGAMRIYLQYEGKTYTYPHVVWDFLNPEEPRMRGDVIHHIDGDSTNNFPNNLKKMTLSEHTKHHGSSKSPEARRKISNSSKAKHKSITHCIHGHPFEGENVSIRKKQWNNRHYYERVCRECGRRASRKYQARLRAEIKTQEVGDGA